LLLWLFPNPAPAAVDGGNRRLQTSSDRAACLDATRIVERETRLPRMLLSTISLVETGKWDRATGENTAWPWTVNVRGTSRYYKTKSVAIAAVRRFQSSGLRSIDVGCMQINLRFHAKAFPNLEQAFDPYANVSYAAKFLKHLRKKGRSWNTAIGHYHSRMRIHYLPYRKKVQNLWRAERRRVALERPAAALGRVAEH
jgi:hypothetical protein